MSVSSYLTHMLILVLGQALMFINALEVLNEGGKIDKKFMSTVIVTNVVAIVAGLLVVMLAQSLQQ